jgi:hypothetical protein
MRSMRRDRRRGAAALGRRLAGASRLALGLLLVGFLFESALHSVHHLDADGRAADCWVASATGSLSIVGADIVVLDDVRRSAVALPADPAPRAPARRPLLATRGRAPPSVLFA